MEKTPRIKITNIDAKNYLRVSVITFERVELNDAGTYTCIGFERRGGIEKAKHNLTVLGIYSVDFRIICLVFSMYIRFHNSFFKLTKAQRNLTVLGIFLICTTRCVTINICVFEWTF